MTLSAPKQVTWFIALGLGLLGALQHYRVLHIGALAEYAVALIIGAWALLLVASAVKNL